jgi:hypothetical protein
MMVADLAPAEPGEVGFGLVGARVIIGVLDRVIDPPGVEPGMPRVPGRGLIGSQRSLWLRLTPSAQGVALCERHAPSRRDRPGP